MSKNKTQTSRLSRRGFIQSSLAVAAGLGLAQKNELFGGTKQDAQAEKSKIREYRVLGRTGFKVSDIGFGAGDLTEPALFEAALDAGVNYVDTAEHYARGNSERTIGQAIKNRDRKKLFITGKLNFGLGKSTK